MKYNTENSHYNEVLGTTNHFVITEVIRINNATSGAKTTSLLPDNSLHPTKTGLLFCS